MYNQGLIGKEFDAGDGETAVYVDERRVGSGFINIMACLPHHTFDHGVYGRKVGGAKGKRDGSGWVGIGQPYGMSDKNADDVRAYCDFLGLSMEFIGESTHYEGCLRIVFKKTIGENEAWDIASNSGHWRHEPRYMGRKYMIQRIYRKMGRKQ